ncbi:hypothetical protein RFI_27996 [Reticulomyxa filosa]|uniref:ABC transporter domain-containing protein n=1 Tax=Reticulomyxa filosa TaxID=46433 RepID=X6M705_RETFI|nr:hypothetical protein RFI_27996 [Reticulomyxa filosa]|eukprot:ETO09381.1 hypothetical protein RFI_27996 [Reticulomyxa filosa]
MADDEDTNKESDRLDLDSAFKIDFYIHSYSKKRGRQDEKREVFLESIEGHVEAGTVCAIIGPRNSGKERLLQLLSGRTNKHVCLGEVHVNGTRLAAPQMRAMTSYLQHAGSSLVGQMTVEESVDFTARLVLPSTMDERTRKTKVERVLEEVQLTNVKSCHIDGGVKGKPISAEDRVRVGLDLLAAERVIRDIISLAEVKLLTVFVTMEHPTKLLLEKFQKCLFLSKGKQFGAHQTEENAEKYLEKLLQHASNVFEEIQYSKLNANHRKRRKEQMQNIKKNNYYIKVENDSSLHYATSWFAQFRVLMSRSWLSFKRDFITFLSRIIVTFLWIGLFYVLCHGNAQGRKYPRDYTDLITSLSLGFAGIQGLSLLALPHAQHTAKIFESDMNQNLYRPSAYVVSALVFAFLSLPVTQIFVVICYFFVLGLSGFSNFVYFGLVLLLLAVVCEVLALSIALVTRKASVMYLSAGAIHFIWLLLSGGTIRMCINVHTIVAAVSYVSPPKWAMDGLLQLTMATYQYTADIMGISPSHGSAILHDSYCFGTWRHGNSKTVSFFALGGMVCVLLIAFFISARLVQGGYKNN